MGDQKMEADNLFLIGKWAWEKKGSKIKGDTYPKELWSYYAGLFNKRTFESANPSVFMF